MKKKIGHEDNTTYIYIIYSITDTKRCISGRSYERTTHDAASTHAGP